jgi:predicted nucleotidyltransferase
VNLTAPKQAALDAFCRWLRSRFGDRITSLRLFGSHARGESRGDSDLDVLVVVDRLSSAEARELAQMAGDAMTEHDVRLSPLALSVEAFERLTSRERRIAREIERDGIRL